jgi:hypothetical protein
LLFDLQGIGVDLRDLWRDGNVVTPRFVLMLVGQLPDTSAFAASQRGGRQFQPWHTANTLLALNANLLAAANHQRSGKKRGFKPPVELPSRPKPARVVRIADIIARRRSSVS